MATLDATTQAEYAAEVNAADRAQVIVDALADPVTVNVYDGSGSVVGAGQMADPWATVSGYSLVTGTLDNFFVTTSGDINENWRLKFESGARAVSLTFGAQGSSTEAVWSLPSFEVGTRAGISGSVITTTGNRPPVWSGAPSLQTYTAGTGGTYDFSQHISDPDDDVLTYSLVGTPYAGIAIGETTGILSVSALAAAATRSLTIRATDPDGLSADWSVAVTIQTAPATTATYVIRANGASNTRRVYDASTLSGFNGGTWTTSGGVQRVPQAGDIIELEAGTHGVTRIMNLVGSEGNRITVRGPLNGVAVIRRATGATGDFVFEFNGNREITIDGYSSAGIYNCGLKVMYAVSGADSPSTYLRIADSAAGRTAGRYFEKTTVRYCEVDGGWPSTGAGRVGIGIQFNDDRFLRADFPGVHRDGLVVEYCYAHNCRTEGLYMGPNWSQGHLSIKNLTCRYSRFVDCGWDGINIKTHTEGQNDVYGNTVIRCGSAMDAEWYQHYAIGMGPGPCNVFGNLIVDSGHHSVQSYTANGPAAGVYANFPTYIYNNLCIRAGTYSVAGDTPDGIAVGSDSGTVPCLAYVYNNTIVDPDGNAVDINSNTTGGFVGNNLCINGAVSRPSAVTLGSNPTSASFVNAGADDYRLTAATSPLASGTIAPTDYAGTVRVSPDCGAYEYI